MNSGAVYFMKGVCIEQSWSVPVSFGIAHLYLRQLKTKLQFHHLPETCFQCKLVIGPFTPLYQSAEKSANMKENDITLRILVILMIKLNHVSWLLLCLVLREYWWGFWMI